MSKDVKIKIRTADNVIVEKDSVRIVPITNSLDSIDFTRGIVRRVLKQDEFKGRVLTITGYLFNDNLDKIIIGSNRVRNIVCPYRNLSRKI